MAHRVGISSSAARHLYLDTFDEGGAFHTRSLFPKSWNNTPAQPSQVFR